ncbi:MAG: polyribonucleotide nucleotidyltransferase, partial [Deltaproteobacteria bacterium]|nr:polyribonucleotide nucleotidyltransferase [Deltaproteobacteria bacterium]
MIIKKEIEIGGRTLSLETGRVAKQANGAIWARYGETIVLAAAVAEKEADLERDFFPLTVDYRERTAAAGKIPGGFFKREGRPSEKEILSARLIDRPIRPMFPDWFRSKTEVQVMVISADGENDGDILGAIAASAALAISDIPFSEPIAEVSVGRIDGEFVINPSMKSREESDMIITLAGTADSIAMVEGECNELAEGVLIGAIKFGQTVIQEIVGMIVELAQETGKAKIAEPEREDTSDLGNRVKELAAENMADICKGAEKSEFDDAFHALKDEVLAAMAEDFPEKEGAIKGILHDLEKAEMRSNILNDKVRLDGRKVDEVRAISCDLQMLPRAHGSALFTRGQTQALATATLGARSDEQRIDSLEGDYFKRFMMHYNFPSFCTGETSRRFGVSRREIGHGSLAERALKSILPVKADFPYTIRIVSDILESNGSSSMAPVCGGGLALMGAGVPHTKPVAGGGVGLGQEEEDYRNLQGNFG